MKPEDKKWTQKYVQKCFEELGFDFPETEKQLEEYNKKFKGYPYKLTGNKIDPQKIFDKWMKQQAEKKGCECSLSDMVEDDQSIREGCWKCQGSTVGPIEGAITDLSSSSFSIRWGKKTHPARETESEHCPHCEGLGGDCAWCYGSGTKVSVTEKKVTETQEKK